MKDDPFNFKRELIKVGVELLLPGGPGIRVLINCKILFGVSERPVMHTVTLEFFNVKE